MQINFDDGGYVEFTISQTPQKLFITVAAPSADKPKDLIINSAEITIDQLKILMSDFIKKPKNKVESADGIYHSKT